MPAASESPAFRYPPQPLGRRHANYRSYRPWLRDEFSFRCVYCLIREQWGRVTGEFDLEHFLPQIRSPERAAEYDNLFYACRSCNLRKSRMTVPDPGEALTSESVRVYPDGMVAGLTPDAQRIIRVLCLNSPALARWRRTWIRIIELAGEQDPRLFQELMGYPEDLPDLRSCRAPANTRPEGIGGELPDTYVESGPGSPL